jgi:hypothetical protein
MACILQTTFDRSLAAVARRRKAIAAERRSWAADGPADGGKRFHRLQASIWRHERHIAACAPLKGDEIIAAAIEQLRSAGQMKTSIADNFGGGPDAHRIAEACRVMADRLESQLTRTPKEP